jgi:hypothetical protein
MNDKKNHRAVNAAVVRCTGRHGNCRGDRENLAAQPINQGKSRTSPLKVQVPEPSHGTVTAWEGEALMAKHYRMKYRIGDHFIIHDRCQNELNESVWYGIIPDWSFPFPFRADDSLFVERHVGCIARIIDRKRKTWGKGQKTKSYKLQFFTDEYAGLPENKKEEVWIREKDISRVFDPFDPDDSGDWLCVALEPKQFSFTKGQMVRIKRIGLSQPSGKIPWTSSFLPS